MWRQSETSGSYNLLDPQLAHLHTKNLTLCCIRKPQTRQVAGFSLVSPVAECQQKMGYKERLQSWKPRKLESDIQVSNSRSRLCCLGNQYLRQGFAPCKMHSASVKHRLILRNLPNSIAKYPRIWRHSIEHDKMRKTWIEQKAKEITIFIGGDFTIPKWLAYCCFSHSDKRI